MAKSAQERSTCAAGALSERLRRVNPWPSSAVSGPRGSFWWRDMAHLGTRGSPHHYTTSHRKRPTRARGSEVHDLAEGELGPAAEAMPLGPAARRRRWAAPLDRFWRAWAWSGS